MSNTRRWLGLSLLCLALGCGGGDEGNGSSGTGGTGVAGTAAGTGGTAAGTGGTAAGTGGTTAGTSSPAPTAMDCGGVMCTVPTSLEGVAAACCNAMTTTCGMMTAIAGCAPVYTDPGGHSCPSETIAGMLVPGCCADGTACGVVDAFAGTGCAPRSLASVIVGFLDPTVMLTPINCDGTIPPPPADGGMP